MADMTGSREYKIMLKAARFGGGEPQLLRASNDFWRSAGRAFGGAALLLRGSLDLPKDRRLVRFYDTDDGWLNARSYIFRERVDHSGPRRECTLKFRHPDRYLAASRDVKPAGTRSRVKFEEDIKPAFQSLYSFSATQEIPADKKLNRIKDVVKLYPGIRETLVGYNIDDPIVPVSNFTARELVIGGAAMQLGKRLNVWASCVMVVWYDHAKERIDPATGSPPEADVSTDPVVAEFSFKYGGDDQRFGPGTVGRAYDVFQILQTRLDDWVDKDSKTKTAFVYA